MKTLTAYFRKVPVLMFLLGAMGLVLNQDTATAQLPDCVTGTVMYALFNDSTGSGTNAPSQIRSVNYATGAVGGLMGGTTYLISKTSGSNTYYGSAGMGLDAITQRFYVMTQMGISMRKDIISINTLTATMVVIGTTPSSLNDFHFVKVAISPAGTGYAIGVHRDTTDGSFNPARCHPVIRFTTCGATPTPGCSAITLLGYLPNTGNHYHQFNGDIAFDNAGNLYFAAAGYAHVGGRSRYTDARLYRIAAANIPAGAGTGTIPMSLLADYNTLDSTVLNGITFSPVGAMYFSARRFPAGQNPPALSVNQIYRSTTLGTASVVAGFSVPTAGYSVADLGGAYFPNGVLAKNQLALSSNYIGGMVNLRWQVNNNSESIYYEVQRSEDDINFETISRIDTRNPDQGSAVYTAYDVQNGATKAKIYRIRQVMQNGARFYSNVEKVYMSAKINLVDKPNPNPFKNKFDLKIELKSRATVAIRLRNQAGALVYQRNIDASAGENHVTVDGLANLSKGIYVVEIAVNEEIIREKLIKQ